MKVDEHFFLVEHLKSRSLEQVGMFFALHLAFLIRVNCNFITRLNDTLIRD